MLNGRSIFTRFTINPNHVGYSVFLSFEFILIVFELFRKWTLLRIKLLEAKPSRTHNLILKQNDILRASCTYVSWIWLRIKICENIVIVFLTQVEPAIKINCVPSLPQVPPPLSFTMKMDLWLNDSCLSAVSRYERHRSGLFSISVRISLKWI
jgi:hypothetical protein